MELKPCPFCGKPPLLDPMQDGSDWEAVRCINPRCHVQPETEFAPPGTSVEIWNTRQPVTTQEASKSIDYVCPDDDTALNYLESAYGNDFRCTVSCMIDMVQPQTLVATQNAAREMLEAYDGFMAGEPESELTRAVSSAACFGAAAFEKGAGGQAVHALARSFLMALIDPTDQRLDYLRADPSAGQTARDANSALRALTAPEKGAE